MLTKCSLEKFLRKIANKKRENVMQKMGKLFDRLVGWGRGVVADGRGGARPAEPIEEWEET